MPLIRKIAIAGDGVLGVWEDTEGDEYYLKRLQLYPEEVVEIAELSPRKKSEWLASRYLLHILSGRIDRSPCLKDPHGKPYLKDSAYYISMSHTADVVAVMASRYSCGIDIQMIVEKIGRIKNRFCHPDELAFIPPKDEILYLHIIWGAKECIYKSYGKRNLDFKKQMRIDPFKLDLHQDIITQGSLTLGDQMIHFKIYASIFKDMVLVHALEHHLGSRLV